MQAVALVAVEQKVWSYFVDLLPTLPSYGDRVKIMQMEKKKGSHHQRSAALLHSRAENNFDLRSPAFKRDRLLRERPTKWRVRKRAFRCL